MRGYDAASYGEGIADVYDDWYADLGDVDAAVARLAALAEHVEDAHRAGAADGLDDADGAEHADRPAILELGVGTGRLAVPLAATGCRVVGLDASPAMLARLAAKPGGAAVEAVLGDMRGPLPAGPFAVVFVAYNTFFNLVTRGDQEAALAAIADVLAPNGAFVVEAYVPADDGADLGRVGAEDRPFGDAVAIRDLAADRVVLHISRHDPVAQTIVGQVVELTEARGVRLRPFAVRYASPAELDAMAASAGLVLERRDGSWSGTPFGPESSLHVSVYRRGRVGAS